jgi:hypothetical protein
MEEKWCLFAYRDEGGDYSSCGQSSLCGGYFGTCHDRSSRQETPFPLCLSNGTNTISANAFGRKKEDKKIRDIPDKDKFLWPLRPRNPFAAVDDFYFSRYFFFQGGGKG